MKSLQEFKREYHVILFNFSKILYSENIDKNTLLKETDKHNKRLMDLLHILETEYTNEISTENWYFLYLNLIDQIAVTKNKNIALSEYAFILQSTNEEIATKLLKRYSKSVKITHAVYDIFNHKCGDNFETYKNVISFYYHNGKKLNQKDAQNLLASYKKCGPIIDHLASLVLKEKNIKLETEKGFKKLILSEKMLAERGEIMGLYSTYLNYLARTHMFQRNIKNTQIVRKELRSKFKTLFEILIKYESSFNESMVPYLIEMGIKKAPK